MYRGLNFEVIKRADCLHVIDSYTNQCLSVTESFHWSIRVGQRGAKSKIRITKINKTGTK